MDAVKLNWKRGLTRLWIVATAAWYVFAASMILSALSNNPMPRSAESYLPFCAPVQDIIRANRTRQSDPCLLGHDLALLGERERSATQSAYQQCEVNRENADRALARSAEAENADCMARRQTTSSVASANRQLSVAQQRWGIELGVGILGLAALPFVVGIALLLGWRVISWTARGFGST